MDTCRVSQQLTQSIAVAKYEKKHRCTAAEAEEKSTYQAIARMTKNFQDLAIRNTSHAVYVSH
jgi:hypothetical protein